MKWSQGLCAAILLDGFYAFSPRMRAKPRQDRDFPDVPSDPSFFSNAWGFPQNPAAGMAPRSARPQFTSELSIDVSTRLVGDLLARIEEGDTAARERTVRIGKTARP